MMKKNKKRVIAGVLALLLLGSSAAYAFEGNPETAHVYSWVANSFNGQEDTYGIGNQVQHEIAAMFVTPDGSVFTNSEWDEDGHNFSQFKDGQLVNVGWQSHGWGYEGGYAVTANDKYVYYGQKSENEGGGLYNGWPDKYPPTGFNWQGIQRRLRSDIKEGAGFEGGIGKNGATASVANSYKPLLTIPEGTFSPITGMAATNEKLFVASCNANKIWVFDAETMAELDTWEVKTPNTIVLDKNGVLWVNQKSTNKIISFDQNGKELPGEIAFEEGVRPWAMCVDNQNRLLVSDLGPKEWIMVYDNLDATPTFSHTIGEEGGIYSGTPGKIDDMKFYHITGLGVDAQDNLYVANAGIYYLTDDQIMCSGATYLECYDKNNKKLWDLQGTSFVDTVTIDPENENMIYSDHNVYEMDYTKSPGEEWSYYAYTLDPHTYPDDARFHYQYTANTCAQRVMYIQGQKLLFLVDMNGGSMAVYRYDPETSGEIAIPCAYFSRGNDRDPWPPSMPKAGNYAWIDKNGDGQMDEDEYTGAPYDFGEGRDYAIDEKGAIWRCSNNGSIYKIPFAGFNRYGVPQWDIEKTEDNSLLQDFPGEHVRRIWYDAAKDQMYVTLLTQEGMPLTEWREAGDRLVRYSNWSNAGARKIDYNYKLPLLEKIGYTGTQNCAVGFSVSGDYIFYGYFSKPLVYVLKKDTGELYDIIESPAETGKSWALVDTTNSYQSTKLSNGEYLIFVEDDLKSKNWVIRWRDKGGLYNFNEDKTLGVALDHKQLVFPDQEPIIIDGRTMVPMRYIFETLGASVTWKPETGTVSGSNGAHSVMLNIGSEKAIVNGGEMTLDVPAQIINDRTMVPLRVVAEGLGVEVEWDPEEQMVNIKTNRESLKQLGEPVKQ